MKKLMSHIKPFMGILLISISMLFVQAFAELRLPNYMSDIVNVGIQQSGVEHASPEEISEEGLNLIAALLPDQQANLFKDAYVEYDGRYVIKSNLDRTQVDRLVGQAAWTMMKLSEEFDFGEAKGELTKDFNIQDLYPAIPFLESLDKTQAYALALELEDPLIFQTGVVFAQKFYEELNVNLENLQNKYILKTGMSMLGITLVGMLATISVAFLSSRIGSGLARNLRMEIFEKVESFSSSEFDDFSSSSLVVRTTNDVTQIQQVTLMGVRMFFYAPIMAIGGILMIMKRGTDLAWIIVAAVAVLFVLIGVVFAIAVPKFKIIQKFTDRLNLVFRENLSGVMVIRAFGNTEFENNRFDKVNTDRADLSLFINRLMTLLMPLMMFLMNITMLAIIWFGSRKISEGLLQIGDMMAFMQYTMQIIFAFLMISMMFIMVPRALVSMNRINEVLSKENKILDPKVAKNFLEDKKGYVEFEDVCFRYGDAEQCVVKNISFTAKPGQTTAIIGSTGSGKSTIISLIPRLFDVSEGSVKVNGVDVREVSQHDLREQIAYIPQQGILLSGTAQSNLVYGRLDASEKEVLKALEIAQGEFVLSKEGGLGMPISQGGSNVSGGQKQRLSIARAIVKDAPIYIFDDSFSALDFKTDQMLRKALDDNLASATLIIVAQRVNTIMDADQIIVLDEGKIVGKGTHSQLLKTSATYYEIASSQLSKEELNYAN